MAVFLIGEVVNSGDAATGYVADTPNISGDDDFVEGTGAVGIKASATTVNLYTTNQGPTSPYNFSSGGTESGWHMIIWINTKTPTTFPTGIRAIVGNGTDVGSWNVYPFGFYKGGFTTCVVDTARDFDNIIAGTWTLTGNPAQLTAISESGGGFITDTSIMGNFNNVNLDQWTIGLGIRVEDGTFSFEDLRAQDEDNSLWGWWSSRNGQIVGKGKALIGPFETGSLSTTFSSLAESVVFADERVARGFYEILIEGSQTNATTELLNLSSATTGTNARWNLTVSSSCNSYSDTNSVWLRGDQIRLSSNSHLTGTTLINCNRMFQSGSTHDSITVLDANTVSGSAFIVADNIGLFKDSTFEYSEGHALEIPPSVTTPVTYSLDGNQFLNYLADDTSGSAIFNNSGGDVLINITGGGNSPTVRNSDGSTTDVQNPVVLTITNIISGSEVRILSSSTDFPPIELGGTEESGTTFSYNYTFASGLFVDVVVLDLNYKYYRLSNLELTANDQTIPIQQETDRVYLNP